MRLQDKVNKKNSWTPAKGSYPTYFVSWV